MTNSQIASVLEQVADLLEFKGENPFRVRAYRNAARRVHDSTESVAEQVAAGVDLSKIEGIGKDLAGKITGLLQTGAIALLEELKAEIPESVLSLLRVPGLGPKRAATLFRELKVTSLDELRAACEDHRVEALKGFGAKTQETILAGLDIAAEAQQRILWADADDHAQALLSHFAALGAIVQRIEIAGSYRRRRETVGDLDVLVVAQDVTAVMNRLAAYPVVSEVLARGETKMSVRLVGLLQVDLRVVAAESFGAAIQYFTGSQAHNIVVRGLAKDRKLKINEYGVFDGQRQVAGASEEEVYGALGLPCFPPELREGRWEFDWARAGELPRLIEVGDLQGDLHAHTTWTDGQSSLSEMAEAAWQRGLTYLAITDHSKRAAMVGGLTADRLRQQWDEIDAWNAQHQEFTLLKGVEVDILERGGLDLEDDVLAEADWVVASLHFGQSQPIEQITRRVIEAIENPHVSVIAHPTGRLLMRRKPYEIDLEAVFAAAVKHRKCLELNAHPSRLDLDDLASGRARVLGIPIVISTDAHSIDGLAALRYGVQQARRGGLTARDVANTRPWPQLKQWLRSRGPHENPRVPG